MKKIKNNTYEVYRLGSIFGHTGGSFAGLVYDPDGIAPTVNTAQGGLRMPLIIEVKKDNNGSEGGLYVIEKLREFMKRIRIRKLLPEECFKLMGLTVEDCQKCRDVGLSNTALYKAAGNGLICNCVALIMEHLYKAVYDEEYKCYDENFIQPAVITTE